MGFGRLAVFWVECFFLAGLAFEGAWEALAHSLPLVAFA